MEGNRRLGRLARLRRLTVCGVLLLGATRAENCKIGADECARSERPRTVLQVKIYRDFLIVAEGQIGDSHALQAFLLDTGTAPSIVNERVAKELGLVTSASTMTVLGKAVEAKVATLPQLELGPIVVAGLRVQIQDLSQVERDLGVALGGIIGLDMLAKSSFRIDYDHKLIEFGDVSPEGIAVRVDPGSSLVVARVILRSKPVRLLVDTGTDQVVLLRENFTETERFGLRRASQEGATVRGHAEPMEVLLGPELVVEGRPFSVRKAYVVPGGNDRTFDGLLGVRALGFRALAYDRARGAIYLQK